MTKTLASGLQVDDDLYYRILEWKDRHPVLFDRFVEIHFGMETEKGVQTEEANYSINSYSKQDWMALRSYILDNTD